MHSLNPHNTQGLAVCKPEYQDLLTWRRAKVNTKRGSDFISGSHIHGFWTRNVQYLLKVGTKNIDGELQKRWNGAFMPKPLL